MPAISVIVPVYNGEKYIENCVRNIRNQTLKDVEIIFVDDGSTDGTLEHLRRLESKVIKVFTQKNTGAGGARTHATIAAYSSCVPTLVVGYSVKARGIARDLFGTEDGYVVPVQELTDVDTLRERFSVLMGSEKQIRSHLVAIVPNIVKAVLSAVAYKNWRIK